ncbi:unnamed protein product [Prorocentrum cordatum]|uniref:Uncharacterized protein n=1 Tax=Prorocentrum cordatum TaxID=2364126 RepID=A0ABN9URW5_9DINO|nr:unnamed protein product [Polarella glacialis]
MGPSASETKRPRRQKLIEIPSDHEGDAAASDQQDSDEDSEEKDQVICTICDKPIRTDERRFRTCRMHYKRGLAARSAQGVASRSSKVQKSMSKMKEKDPAKYKAMALSMVASGRRSAAKVAKFKSAIVSVTRSDSTFKKAGRVFCNKLQHVARQRYVNGLTKKRALKMWAKDLADKGVFKHKVGDQIPIAAPKQAEDCTPGGLQKLMHDATTAGHRGVAGFDDEDGGIDSDEIGDSAGRSLLKVAEAGAEAVLKTPTKPPSRPDGSRGKKGRGSASAASVALSERPSRRIRGKTATDGGGGAQDGDEAATLTQIQECDEGDPYLQLSGIDVKGACKPTVFIRYKRLLAAVLEGHLEQFLLGANDEGAIEAMTSLFGPLGDDSEVQCLGIPEVLNKAKGVMGQMKTALDDVTAWKLPCDIPGKRAAVEKTIARFDATFSEMKDYCTALQGALAEQAKRDKKAKRGEKGKKDKMAKAYEDHGTFRCIAALVPAMIYTEKSAGDDGKPDASVGEPGASTPCQPFEFECITDGGKIDMDSFTKARSFWLKDCSHWHSELRSHAEKNEKLIKEKKERLLPQFADCKGTHVSIVLTKGDQYEKFNFNPKDKEVFTVDPVPPSNLVLQRTMVTDVSSQVFPLRGAPHFITVIEGLIMFVIVSSEAVGQNIVKYLENGNGKSLLKAPCFLLKQGQSVWVPFGNAPLVVGIEPEGLRGRALATRDSSIFEPGYKFASKGSNGKEKGGPSIVSYIQTFVLDANLKGNDSDVRADAAASVTRGMPSLPKVLNSSLEKIKEWTAAIL